MYEYARCISFKKKGGGGGGGGGDSFTTQIGHEEFYSTFEGVWPYGRLVEGGGKGAGGGKGERRVGGVSGGAGAVE